MELFVKVSSGSCPNGWLRVLAYHGNGAPGGFVFTCWNHLVGDYITLEIDQVSEVELRAEGAEGLQYP